MYEQTLKKQAFQDQQKKLKEFTNMTGRNLNADAMIQHIVGPTAAPAPRPGRYICAIRKCHSTTLPSIGKKFTNILRYIKSKAAINYY